MTYTIVRANRVNSSEADEIWLPRVINGSTKYGVVLNHGANTPGTWTYGGQSNFARMAAALANAGIPCIAPSDTVDWWFTDTHMSRITAAASTLASYAGCSSTKMQIIGSSMGSGASLRYASLNPSTVASVNAMIPAVNPIALYKGITPSNSNNNLFTANIGNAWAAANRRVTVNTTNGSAQITATSGSFTSADVNGVLLFDVGASYYVQSYQSSTQVTLANAVTATNSFSGSLYAPLDSTNANVFNTAATIKANNTVGRLLYASNDPYITPSDVTTFGTNSGLTAIQVSTTGGHGDATAGDWRVYNGGTEWSDLIAYLVANGS